MADDTLARMFWARVDRGGAKARAAVQARGRLEDAVLAGGRDRRPRGRPGPARARETEGRCRRGAVDQPRRVGAGRLRHLLRRLPDHPHLPHLPAGPRRGTSSATRRSRRSSWRTPAQLAKVMAMRRDTPGLEQVVVMQGYEGKEPWVLTWEALRRLGRDNEDKFKAELAGRVADGRPEDIATIVYTSGHDGPAKGGRPDARQSHGDAGVVETDAARRGGRRAPALPPAGPLLRPARGLRRGLPRAHHGVRREHRQARAEPAGGEAALHLQRAARLREGVRRRHDTGRGRLAAQEAHLPLGRGRRQAGLAAQAGPPSRARGPRRSSTGSPTSWCSPS